MNGLAFDKSEQAERLDANFISIFNSTSLTFDYYVERLLGVGIENEKEPSKGRVWVPFVNNGREDWSEIVEKNMLVKKTDTIIWRFERQINLDSTQQTEFKS